MIPVGTSAPARRLPLVVLLLIGGNVAVFLHMLSLPPAALDAFVGAYALEPAAFGADLAWIVEREVWLRLLTNAFLHAGILHIVLNMWTLWLFGAALERRLGPLRFALLYLLAGVAGSVTHLVFNLGSEIPAVGASGAIAGVIGAFSLAYPLARVTLLVPVIVIPLFVPIPALAFSALWFAIQVTMGTAALGTEEAGGIAWWAHIGGFTAGVALLPLLVPARRRRR